MAEYIYASSDATTERRLPRKHGERVEAGEAVVVMNAGLSEIVETTKTAGRVLYFVDGDQAVERGDLLAIIE